MWALRGAQSAAFYYASCTPCLDFQSRRRLQEQHRRDASLRDAAIAAFPHGYQQPAPFTTNEFWASEIASRPTPHYALAMEAMKRGTTASSGTGGSSVTFAEAREGARVREVGRSVPSRQMINKVSHAELQEVVISSIGAGAKATAWAERKDNQWMKAAPPAPRVMNGRATHSRGTDRSEMYSLSKRGGESGSARDGSSRTQFGTVSVDTLDAATGSSGEDSQLDTRSENRPRAAQKHSGEGKQSEQEDGEQLGEEGKEDEEDEEDASHFHGDSRHRKTASSWF